MVKKINKLCRACAARARGEIHQFLKLTYYKSVLRIRIRIRTDLYLKSPPGSGSAWTDADPDPDPGGKKA